MKAADFNDRPTFPLLKQSDIVSFFHLQMPRWLFCDSRYKAISLEAKVAYTFLLNRFQLSRMNGWVNSDNEVFVVFTRESLAEEMRISVRKAMECFKELSSVELIWERRLGRGYPNQIYLASVELSERDADTDNGAPFEKGRPADFAGQDLQKTQANKIENIDTELNEIERSPSVPRAERLEELLSRCGLEELPNEPACIFRNAIERLWYADKFTVDGIELPREKLRADLLRLHPGVLHRTLDKLRENTVENIRCPTAYIMAALMNNIWDCLGGELLDPELNRLEREVRRIASQLQEDAT